MKVYLLWHNQKGNLENRKLLGVFNSSDAAECYVRFTIGFEPIKPHFTIESVNVRTREYIEEAAKAIALAFESEAEAWNLSTDSGDRLAYIAALAVERAGLFK